MRRIAPALVLAGSLATACSTPHLPDERRIVPYAGLADRAASAQRLERVRVAAPGEAPLEIALRVSHAAHRSALPTIVLVNGIFADGTTWRFLVGALADELDVVAVDPPGTGASDKPDPERARPEAYTPTWTAEHVLLALEAREKQANERPRYVLVGHSIGGTAVLRMFADPALGTRHRDLLARVEGAVLLAPADVALEKVDPRVAEVTEVNDLTASLGASLGIVRAKVAEGIHDGVVDPPRLAFVQEADRITCMMVRPETRHAAQAMLKRFQPTDACGRRDLAAARALAEQERAIAKPILILWGERDDTLPFPQSGPVLQRLAAVAGLEAVPNSMHSVHQERVDLVAERIRAFSRDPAAAVAAAPIHASTERQAGRHP